MEAKRDWTGYMSAVGSTAACTLAGLAMAPRFDPVNIAMVYLLAVVYVALRHTRGAAVATAALAVATFDYLFVPPLGAFTVDDAQYLLTFAIMIAVALVISSLTANARNRARAQAALEVEAETERIRSTLLASISHDLRTPLAVLTGASSTLAEHGERLSPQERGALALSIFTHSSEMSEHVAKVLEMTRLEAVTLGIERDWASVAEIASSVLDRLAGRLEAHRVMVEIPADLPLVRVDAALVEQALANLLENAARHTPEGTVVRLMARQVGGELVVSVEDYAGGLAEADLERVFAKFHRGELESATGGVGLGLAIVRAVARLHRGRAWAERVPAGGTVFRIAFPVEPMPSPPQEP